ncbi:MAG: hypothetical protein JSS86_16185 [Cyanobacteria bacterium SZAS LIN-2]|nr:hypothetical protein [Cyanobacteria bacterium SZAS LIN-2]
MATFQQSEIVELLGITPIAHVTDDEIWQHLVTPTVKGLLGEVKVKEPARLLDTRDGLFKGDSVSNLNHHDIKGPDGKERVRYPYLHAIWRTVNGAVVFKRDGVKFEVFCWFGDVDRERAELMFKAALRDRRYDGTVRANDCALLEYTYDNPHYHQRLSTELSSVELSIYGFMPGSRIVDATGDAEFDSFVANPFRFIDDTDHFLSLFQRALASKRSPGQFSAAIPDVSHFTMRGFEFLARKCGYDLLEMAASHYHVAKWAMNGGFALPDASQALVMSQLAAGLDAIRAKGTPLTRTQQSWACVVQSLRPVDKIPPTFYMGNPDLVWPQDNISDYCLWLYKPLSAKAKDFHPAVKFLPEGEDPAKAPERRRALRASGKRRK